MMKRIFPVLLIISASLSFESKSQSTDYDVQIGEAAAEIYIATYGTYHDPNLKAFVDAVGQGLVQVLSDQIFHYHFIILDDHTPNAFALPGGFIFVSRGLLALISSPDELAGVLAHEIVHVQKRHGVNQMSRNILPTLLQLPFQMAGTLIGGKMGKAIESSASAGATLYRSSYSRKNESEADQLGIILAARAGYDPSALSSILQRISSWEASLTETEESRSYFSDHPYTPDRIEIIQNKSPQIEWQPNATRDTVMANVLQNLMVWINPAKGVFVENVLLHPNLNISVTFPEKWTYVNQILLMKAVNSEQTASITMGIERTAKSPKLLAKDLIKELELKDKGRNLTIGKRELLINDSSAYLLKVSERINREVMTVSIIWLVRGDLVYKFISVSNADIETLMLDCAGSLREITAAEKVNINEFRLQFVGTTSGNEGFSDFCRMSGNVLNEEMWRVLNDWEAEQEFTENEKVRIIVKNPYYQ